MPAGGELAALFARRAKVADGEGGPPGDAKELIAMPTAEPQSAPGLPPHTPPRPPAAKAATPLTAPPTPVADEPDCKPTEPDVKAAANPLQNSELRAAFDSRNLEKGIPTPSFLADVRANLRKPGEGRAASEAGAGDGVDAEVAKRAMAAFGTINHFGAPPSRHAKSNSFTMAPASDDNVQKMAGGKIRSAASACSADSAPLDESAAAASAIVGNGSRKSRAHRSNSESGTKSETLAARRSRMVASRGAVLSSDSPKANSAEKTAKQGSLKASPSNLRREKLLARVRASQSGGKSHVRHQSDTGSNVSFDPAQTSIISPKRDEFEVLFADGDFNFSPDGSIDSISNEVQRTLSAMGSQSTLPTGNHSGLQPKISKNNVNVTPEKSRLHNASTPKIRGNGNYRRDRYDDTSAEGSTGGNKVKPVPSNASVASKRDEVLNTPRNGKRNSLPSFQEQQQQQMAEQEIEDQLKELGTPRRQSDALQAYPLRNSPSQMSQMSGLTTPSCFPQEFHVPSGPSIGPLQQPMLVGGPIYETASMEAADAAFGIGTSTGAFSSGADSENRRLREQLGNMTKKLEEKDAIISQLMKRIGDLEAMQSAFNTGAQLDNLAPTPSSGAGDPFALSTLWDSSQQHGAFEPESPRGSLPGSRSVGPSPRQKQQKRLSGSRKATKMSPHTVATTSTASVTTANSSKSGKSGKSGRKLTRSRSASEASGGKTLRQKKTEVDPRKFVC